MGKNKNQSDKTSNLGAKRHLRKPNAKIESTWHKSEEKSLIKLVQQHKCLYNKNCGDKRLRQAAWKSISDEFGGKFDPVQCGVKWRVLRGSYRRVQKEMEADPNSEPSWLHYYSMQKLVY